MMWQGKYGSEHDRREHIDKGSMRIAFLFPSLARGGYWQPVLKEFTRLFPNSLILTGIWEGFLPSCRNGFQVKIVGRTRFVQLPLRSEGHYPPGLVLAPLGGLIGTLLRTRPHVIFVSGFSIWTAVACILKTYGRWKLIIIYDGSSPSVDRTNSRFNLVWRRFLARRADAFVSNATAGKDYLVKFLNIPSNKVFVHPYQVPDLTLWHARTVEGRRTGKETVFVSVGRLIKQKGVHLLIEAVRLLCQQASDGFSVLIVGDGPQREELRKQVAEYGLTDVVKFVGHVEYERLGCILEMADVFVFPSLEDVWGVAPLEAMALGKPVLCSKYAGAREMIEDGVNGWVFDPYDTERLAQLMKKYIDDPTLASTMGQKAEVKMRPYTPEAAAQFFAEVISKVAIPSSF